MVRRKKPKYQRPARKLRRDRSSDAGILLNAPSRREILADATKAELCPLGPREHCTVVTEKSAVVSVEFACFAGFWFKPPEKFYRLIHYNRRDMLPPSRDFFEFHDRQLKFAFMDADRRQE